VRKFILVVVFLAICPLAFAQQAHNNDSIIKLVKAGLSEDLIVTTINASPGSYDTSADGIIALKTAGASDKVVAAIVAKANAPAPAAAPPVAADPNDPNAPHAQGMYIYTANTMTPLTSTAYQTKTSQSLFNNSSIKITAILGGAHAGVQSSDRGAIFYFYANDNDANTPDQFVLLHLVEQGGNRQSEFVPAGMLKSGATFKDNIPFTSRKVVPGVYKLTLSAPLLPGEYCFFVDAQWYATSARENAKMKTKTTSRVYDFDVQ